MDILIWIAAGERSRFQQVSNDDLEMYCVLCIDGSLIVLVHSQVYVTLYEVRVMPPIFLYNKA
jgi:hypothetical protein